MQSQTIACWIYMEYLVSHRPPFTVNQVYTPNTPFITLKQEHSLACFWLLTEFSTVLHKAHALGKMDVPEISSKLIQQNTNECGPKDLELNLLLNESVRI